MSDHDLHLGLSDEQARQEWMILTGMPFRHRPVRPSIDAYGAAMRSADDMTYKLPVGDIIKASANVRRCEQEGAPAHVVTEFEQLLQIKGWLYTSLLI